MGSVVLVRYGEIGLRGQNRPWFENILRERLRTALADLPGTRVSRQHGRFFVYSAAPADQVLARVTRVFGVVSASPVAEVAPDMEAIGAAAVRLVAADLADRTPPGPVPFRVEARRSNKGFALTSMEISRQLGGVLLDAFSNLQVNLSRPELVVTVEVRDQFAYVFGRRLPGPGGLPYGSGGKALLLLSGGIDSPVAGYQIMRRGVELAAVHFHTPPFTSPRAREKAVDLSRVLAGWAGARLRLYIVHFTEVQKALRQHTPEELTITLMRRFMLRIAAALAAQTEALALITGESIGQVASQTLESIQTINEVVSIPVFRPLIGADKQDIVAAARRIGTYDISIRPYEDCCALFVPKNPKTRPRPAQARAAESALAVDELVSSALAATESVLVSPAETDI